MHKRLSRTSAASAVAVLAALCLSGALLWYLPRPGYSTTRLALFAVLAGLAWLGAAGVLRGRPMVAVAGGVGLGLLGFWQAALWIWILPTAAALLVAAVLADRRPTTRGENGNETSRA